MRIDAPFTSEGREQTLKVMRELHDKYHPGDEFDLVSAERELDNAEAALKGPPRVLVLGQKLLFCFVLLIVAFGGWFIVRGVVWLCRLSFVIALATCLVYAQPPAYFHDPTLDMINNNVALGYSGLQNLAGLAQQIYDTNLVGATGNMSNLVFSATIDGGMQYDWLRRYRTNLAGTGGVIVDRGHGTSIQSNSTLMQFYLTNGAAVGLGSNFTYQGSDLGSNNNEDASGQLGEFDEQITIPGGSLGLDWNLTPNWAHVQNFMGGGSESASRKVPQMVRVCVYAIAWLIFALNSMEYLQKRMSDALNQRQVLGSRESIMGTNASALIGMGFAAAVTVAIGVMMGAVAVLGAYAAVNSGGGMDAVHNVIDYFANTYDFYDSVSQFIPMWGLFTIWCYYVVFTRVLIWPMHITVRTLTFWLVS